MKNREAKKILVGDIGGTNARFAIGALKENETGGEHYSIIHKQVFRAEDYEHLNDALHAYLESWNGDVPSIACLGVAGQVHRDEIILTNSHWSFIPEQVRKSLDLSTLHIINDFHAMTRGAVVPESRAAMVSVREGERDMKSPIAVLGPGTGLGLGIAQPTIQPNVQQDDAGFIIIPTEGGHAGFAPRTEEEIEVLRFIRNEHAFVSIERLLSGRGLVNIHRALCAIHGKTRITLRPDEITKAALDQSLPIARMAVDMFCAILGGYAGDIAVTTGARGGVIIAGGIVPRIKDILMESAFEQRFVERDAMSSYVEPIAVDLLPASEDAALLGAVLSVEK